MADVFRGPLVVGRRDPPVPTSTIFVATSLLLTTLAALPLPVGAQSFPNTQPVPHRQFLNADTTRSSPPVLIRALPEKPVGENAPFIVVETRKLRLLAPNWSISTPPLYYRTDPVVPLGRVNAPHFAPEGRHTLRWLFADTTQGQPVALKAVIPAPPFIPAPDVEAPRYPHLVVDTTQDSPQTVRADAQLPVFVPPPFGPSAPGANAWLPASTTAGQPITLQAIVPPPPFVPPPDLEAMRLLWLPADTTQDTAQTLRQDAQAPVGDAQTFTAPDRTRPVVDTSLGMFYGLRAAVPAPPFVPPPHLSPPLYIARPFDVVRLGVPKALLADAQLPVRNLQHTPPDRVRPVVNTTLGMLPRLAPPVVLAAEVTASDSWVYAVALTDAPQGLTVTDALAARVQLSDRAGS